MHAQTARRLEPAYDFPLELKGHSGARLELRWLCGTSIVRKTAGTTEQNERLLRQGEKQRRLTLFGLPLPRVIGEGRDGRDRAFFDMEYVPAPTVAAILCEGRAVDPQSVAEALRRCLALFRLTRSGELPDEGFHAKIDEVAGRCAGNAHTDLHRDAIAATAVRLHGYAWNGIPASLGHGDLTLENMLQTPKQTVLIDCDCAWVSSDWLDLAKMGQDILGHWCLRQLYLAGSPDLPTALERLAGLKPLLDELAQECDPALPARLPQLAALHLLRTLPYVRDEKVAGFVLARISHVLSAG
ncbi:MAG: phosphotransferase [Alphaproteobacteria bacterium]|nr:phosphotransferase [Alphaproteobacteria bacterium]